jgi:hypothetical protein
MVSRLTTRELYWPYPSFSAFHFTASFISQISVLIFSALFIPSLICRYSACSPVLAPLYPDHLLIITLSTPPPPPPYFSSPCPPPYPNSIALNPTLTPSFFFPPRLYFLFLASNLFLLLMLPYFIIHLSFCPLLFLSSTFVFLHVFPLNHIFVLQFLFCSYSLISIFFILLFTPSSSPLMPIPFYSLCQ